MPVNAAGCRIEPPVSVPVAPSARLRRHRRGRAARRAARHQRRVRALPPPRRGHRPERGLVRRAHGELVVVGLAEQHRAVAPELRGHGRLVGRHEIVEDVRARRGAHTFGAEHVLDRERNAFQRAGFACRDARVGGLGHRAGALRRLQHIGVERARLLDRGKMRVGKLRRREFLLLEAVRASAMVSVAGSLIQARRTKIRTRCLAVGFTDGRSGPPRPRAPSPCGNTVTSHSQGCALRFGLFDRVEISVKQIHLFTGLAPLFHHFRHEEVVLLGRRRVMQHGVRIVPSVTTSGRFFIAIGVTEVIGSTPSTLTSESCSTNARMALISPRRCSTSSSATAIRARCAMRRTVLASNGHRKPFKSAPEPGRAGATIRAYSRAAKSACNCRAMPQNLAFSITRQPSAWSSFLARGVAVPVMRSSTCPVAESLARVDRAVVRRMAAIVSVQANGCRPA